MLEKARQCWCPLFPALGVARLRTRHLKDGAILQAARGKLLSPHAAAVEANEAGCYVQAECGPVSGNDGLVGE